MLAFPVPLPQPDLPQLPQSCPQDASHPQSMTSPPPISPYPPPLLQKPRLLRPRLCIDTQQNRTFGKGSSLRLETLSAISPTIRNTFSNGYEPKKAVEEASNTLETPITPGDSRTPSSTSSSSASTILEPHAIPYSQPHSLRSALVNSPIPRADFRRMSISHGRPMFPPEKRVSFREPLSEEIQTTRFTWAHSDIAVEDIIDNAAPAEDETASSASSTDGTSDTISLGSIDTNSTTDSSRHSEEPLRPARPKHRHTRARTKIPGPNPGDKRDSSSESDSDACPETPVAGRRKRVREWTWTLGALPAQPAEAKGEPADAFATAFSEGQSPGVPDSERGSAPATRLGLFTAMLPSGPPA